MATFSPSTALSTEIDGVITPSPKNSAAPNSPAHMIQRLRPRAAARNASTIKARMPPSPRLSARISTRTYLMVTTSISAQAINDSTPKTRRSLTIAFTKHCLTV